MELAIIFIAITIWVVAPMLIFGRKGKGKTSTKEVKRLAFLEEEYRKSEARLQNLETIICDVDLELNSKLNRLASRQLEAPLEVAALPTEGGPGDSVEAPGHPAGRSPC